VRDLTQDPNTAVLVGYGVIDLDASVHRTWVEHNRMGLQPGRTLRSEAE